MDDKGGSKGAAFGAPAFAAERFGSFWGMEIDFVTFTEEMDRCWMERRFSDLSRYIADDVVMVAPGGTPRMEGLDAAVESYRQFMGRSEVSRFVASDHIVTLRGHAAIVEYDWRMAWRDHGIDNEAKGREILAVVHRDTGWRVVWRTQLPV
jgi:hypothetical protein